MIKKILLSVIALFVLLVLSGIALFQYNKSPQIFEPSIGGLYHEAARPADPKSQRNTSSGQVVGFSDNYNTYAWLGIPYAEPPTGELRWKAPRSYKTWSGVRSATEYGGTCLQFWGALAGTDGEPGDIVGQEDCLSLNVWAPKEAANKKYPTMVWIHGGGNDSGTASMYQGHHLAGSQKVVVVTMNYRVGLLGWLSHRAIRETASNREDASGNFGTLDLIQALKWVQSNISEFGGDPNNITIFGESAGGRNVYSLIASPLAKGLFDKAIVQSGTVDTTLRTLAEDFPDQPNTSAISGLKNSSNALIELALKRQKPNASSQELRKQINDMSSQNIMFMMKGMDAKELMQLASDNSDSENGYMRVARVIRDGYVIPDESLLTLFTDPNRYNSVPLITGTTRDEQKVFMARNTEYVDLKLGVLPSIKDPELYQAVSDYVSQNWKAGAVDEPAKIISANLGEPVFAYRFDWDDMMSNALLDLPKILGAAHGMEINYVFGDFIGGLPFDITYNRGNAAGREALAQTIMSYWANFAYTSDPANGRDGKLPQWSAWNASGNNVLLLDAENDGGVRMAEVRTNVADIKRKLTGDTVFKNQKERCKAFAALFLHGYQTSDFWNSQEYLALGCAEYPVGIFRES